MDLELLSIATRTPAPLACSIITSIFQQVGFYLPAKIILTLSIITSKTTVSSSESCFINKVSTCLLVTTIAARFLPSPDVKILYFFYKPAILLNCIWFLDTKYVNTVFLDYFQ